MVKIEKTKFLTEHKPIERFIPSTVYIPLIQHTGKPTLPLVKAGDYVFLGQKIADIEANITAPVHSSVSGKIKAIQTYHHPTLGGATAIVVENDGQDKTERLPLKEEEVKNLTSKELRLKIREAGIVGLGGAGFPTYVKLNPPKPVDTLIVNGAECEPYLTGDFRLMLEKTGQIIKGIELIARCLEVKNIYIAIEDNKPEAIRAFEKELKSSPITHYKLHILKSYYPQGGEKQLIKNILKKEVPSGGLPFDVGVVVHNVATCFAIYEAVYLNKPLYERVITVSGSCLTNPKNILARIGTPIRDLIDFCGPLKERPRKIVLGGPMMGVAQYTDEVPLIKTTTGVIVFGENEVLSLEESFCIRCGRCVKYCPVGLMPAILSLSSQSQNWQLAKEYNVFDCIECGLCGYVCPAKRNMVQYIKSAKLVLLKNERR
ncbi:MAG: electron transport complex subunit RsxC [Candidatus Omnitrophica bacterium]|nr:electron transport complex subunit RsxC [Candidatus Omnitrophota bacterium]MCM8799164.1 electron transport complex subunit RsxC [Candidatus Omnitrophota bacterium]